MWWLDKHDQSIQSVPRERSRYSL